MDNLIAMFEDTNIGSLNLFIFSLFIGACLAGFATVYHKRTIGTLIRYLLEQEAFSPETAKTLREAEQDLNIFIRWNIRHNVAFQRLVVEVDEGSPASAAALPLEMEGDGTAAPQKQKEKKKKKRNLSDVPLYIHPAAKERAEQMYSRQTSDDANMWMVLLSILIFAVIAYISTMVVPKLISFAQNIFG